MTAEGIRNLAVNFEAKSYRPPGRYGNRILTNTISTVHDLLRNAIVSPIKNLIFYASSTKFSDDLNHARLEESREFLRSIGGETVILKNPDGTLIEGMYLDVKQFKQRLVESDIQFEYKKNALNQNVQIIRAFSRRAHNILDKLKIEYRGKLTYSEAELPRDGQPVERIDRSTPGVTILTLGNASIFEFDRPRIAEVLLSGQNCMAFNIRSTGRSEGTISEKGTYEDIESVYQFLRTKGFKNNQITVWGYCLGGGYASELAARHRGVNLTLDRSYQRVGDIAGKVICKQIFQGKTLLWGIPEKIIYKTISQFTNVFFIGYDNESRIKRVQGQVCILEATEDDLIPMGSAEKLERSSLQAKRQSRIQLLGAGHNDSWTSQGQIEYSSHLRTAKILRDFGTTPRPVSLKKFRQILASSIQLSENVSTGSVTSHSQSRSSVEELENNA